jgi:hypothetical protein
VTIDGIRADGFDAGPTLTGTEELVGMTGGVAYNWTPTQLRTFAWGNFTTGGALAGTEKLSGLDGTTRTTWTPVQIAAYVRANLGTVTSGVWHGTRISPQYGGTGLDTALLAGEMLRGSGGDPLLAIPAGARHQILTVSGDQADMPWWEYPYIATYYKSADYTFVLADGGSMYVHPSADTTARTWTIPANASVAFRVGTTITIRNKNSAGDLTIAINSDTLRLVGTGATGSRTLAADGLATAVKETSTEWFISGTGLT